MRAAVEKVITVPANLEQACREFNGGLYFECHETLEEVWQEEQGEVRDLYKGLIQVAAAYVHLTRGNYRGADRLLTTAIGYLAPYRGEGAMGFDVEAICRRAEAAHRRLRAEGPDAMTYERDAAPVFAFEATRLPAEARRWAAWGFDRAGHALPMTITVVE